MNDSFLHEIAVLNAVLELPATQRAVYLDQACAGRPELRQRLDALLAALERAGPFMEKSRPCPGLPTQTTVLLPEGEPGERIGPYKLLERIGEGGCGIVFVAEHEAPVRRRVALKVIKPG